MANKANGTELVQRKIFLFIGTTAELIKLAPVINELKLHKLHFTIVTTGQNDIQYDEFKKTLQGVKILKAVTPKSKSPSVGAFILWAIRTFFSLMIGMRKSFAGLNKNNSFFIIHGDTVSSLMGSLVATLYGLKLVHIESGLRSYNFLEPFPEEISRYIVSKLAHIHFCPNNWSINNLAGINGEKINTYQNTLLDAYAFAIKQQIKNLRVKNIIKMSDKYFVLIVHRQEHVSFGFKYMYKVLAHIFATAPTNIKCVLLVHDQSEGFMYSFRSLANRLKSGSVLTLSRMPYPDFIHLLRNSEFVITDGGSNQEELYYMGKPCLLIRNFTERIEGLGTNVLLSKNNLDSITSFIKNYKKYKRKPVKFRVRPSKIIVNHLKHYDKNI